jgi:methylated-DNA-protein-cysteine methyltransferase-like protein
MSSETRAKRDGSQTVLPAEGMQGRSPSRAGRGKPGHKRALFSAFLRVVRRIPSGTVSTYGGVARKAGHPGMARQVAWALHGCCPDVPWHRVVGAGGRILLRGEAGLEQRLRLRAEGIPFRGARVDLKLCEYGGAPSLIGRHSSPRRRRVPSSSRRSPE